MATDENSGPFKVIRLVRCDETGGVPEADLIMDAIDKAQSEFCPKIEPKH